MSGKSASRPTKTTKLGAEKLTPEEQRRRFEELAREAGCDEGSDARFEAAIEKIAKHQTKHTDSESGIT